MRFRTKNKQERHADMRRWRLVFVLWPKQVAEGDWRWLEYVEMRHYRVPHRPGSFTYSKQYRACSAGGEGYPSGFDLFGEGEVPSRPIDPPKPIPQHGAVRIKTVQPRPNPKPLTK